MKKYSVGELIEELGKLDPSSIVTLDDLDGKIYSVGVTSVEDYPEGTLIGGPDGYEVMRTLVSLGRSELLSDTEGHTPADCATCGTEACELKSSEGGNQGIKCPLCGTFEMTNHEYITNENHRTIWICSECPAVIFEFWTEDDLQHLNQRLIKGN